MASSSRQGMGDYTKPSIVDLLLIGYLANQIPYPISYQPSMSRPQTDALCRDPIVINQTKSLTIPILSSDYILVAFFVIPYFTGSDILKWCIV